MASHMSNREFDATSTGYVPSATALQDGRRNFRLADKKRIVAEGMAPGTSVSGVARRYGIDTPLLFRWKREFASPPPAPPGGGLSPMISPMTREMSRLVHRVPHRGAEVIRTTQSW